MFSVECHCRNMKLVASKLPSSITSCNCSFCNRLGALWAYFDLKNVEIFFWRKINKYIFVGRKKQSGITDVVNVDALPTIQ